MTFQELNLNNELLKAIEELGYTEPTEIQAKAIPLLNDNEVDFVGQAQTGTGKTAAFALPLLNKIDPRNKTVQSLILAPTRELANQVRDEIVKLSKYTGLKSIAIYGGTSYENQKRGLRKDRPQIVVGTPGRVMDLMKQGCLKFDQIKYMVLDEADEMLNMGFFEDVQEILASVNPERRLWMFSATMPQPILKLVQKDFRDPEVIKIEKKSLSNADIDQRFYLIRERNYKEALCRILDSEPEMYGIVFCRTRQDTRDLADFLLSRGYSADTLHGELSQHQRDASMAKFKAKKVNLMICTDVAARGIDVNNLTHVINYGAPIELESYVHRIGRTGRAGMKGVAITLADPRQMYQIKRIESFIKQPIKHCTLPTVDTLKKSLVMKGLEKCDHLFEAILEKGEDFKTDETFAIFKDRFDLLSKEEFEKLVFCWIFNKDLKRFREQGSLDEELFSRGGGARSERGGRDGARRGGRNERRGGRDRDDRRGGDRQERSSFGGRDRDDRPKRGGRDARRSGSDARGSSNIKNAPVESGNARLFINVGKRDGMDLNGLLDTISKEVKVDKRDIRNVDLKNDFSFLDVPEKVGQELVAKKKLRINDRPLRLEFTQR